MEYLYKRNKSKTFPFVAFVALFALVAFSKEGHWTK